MSGISVAAPAPTQSASLETCALLHQYRQAIEAFAHVGVAARQPHPNPARDRHHRRPPFVSTAMTALTVAASTGAISRIRASVANSISIASCVASNVLGH